MYGSPPRRRLTAFDDRRSEDLERISKSSSGALEREQEREHAFSALVDPGITGEQEAQPPRPVSGQPYRYRALGGARSELCADSQTDTTHRPVAQRTSVFRVRAAGQNCFNVDALLGEP
jgi:hypothetical protein